MNHLSDSSQIAYCQIKSVPVPNKLLHFSLQHPDLIIRNNAQDFTWTGLTVFLRDIKRAAKPETCGQAILVPCFHLYLEFDQVENISVPGANTFTYGVP